MESTVLNHSQQNILRMLAFVREEQTVSEIENVLKEHLNICEFSRLLLENPQTD